MNIIAIDIGNSNVTVALFVEDSEKFTRSLPGEAVKELSELLVSAWEEVPFVKSKKVKKRDGVIVVSSVKPEWTDTVRNIFKEKLDEKILLIGKDIPLPIEMGVDNASEVGTDRVVSAAAAFAVVEDAVVVADFGTAVTIDLVDEDGVFLGGAICPGFDLSAEVLNKQTAKLPKVEIAKPKNPIGTNTQEAINCGLYYSAIGLLETITRVYAEQIGKWPQVVVTGGAAKIIKDNCDFVDSWVSELAVKGVVLTYKKYLADKAEYVELEKKNQTGK